MLINAGDPHHWTNLSNLKEKNPETDACFYPIDRIKAIVLSFTLYLPYKLPYEEERKDLGFKALQNSHLGETMQTV